MNVDIEFYNKNGYLLLRDFFKKSDIQIILHEAKSIFFKQFKQKKYTNVESAQELSDKQFNDFLYLLFKDDIECISNCGKQVQHLISLHKLSLNQKIVDLLKNIGLSFPNISTRPVLYFNHPNLAKEKVFHTVDAHQDWRSMQGSLNSVVMWLPLVDIDVSLGALQILPKSHLHGLRTDYIENGFGMVNLTPEEEKQLLNIEVELGDALLFSSFLIHQSGSNTTNSPRWSVHFRYNDLNEQTFISRKFVHAYTYKPNDELLTQNFPEIYQIQKIFTNE